MDGEFWITTAAIVIGPVIAVVLSRILSIWDSRKDRRLRVFRELMATRQTLYSMENVKALNMVEIEFYGDRKVIDAYRKLMNLLADQEKWARARTDEETARELSNNVSDRRALLLNELAKSLDYKMSDIEIMRGGYYPSLLSQFDSDKLNVQRYFSEIAQGVRSIPVSLHDFRNADEVRKELEAKHDA